MRWPLLAGGILLALYLVVLDRQITGQFEGRRWQVPARVYAQPLELYAGRQLSLVALSQHLKGLGYRSVQRDPQPGQYVAGRQSLQFASRPFAFWDGPQASQQVRVRFAGASIAAIETLAGEALPLLRLDPRMIGSFVPASGEDRIVLPPDSVPTLLAAALVTVEDRDFNSHHGIDLSAIARAAWVNARAGAVRQGGSTLTQQLVKSFFLDNRRTYRRKAKEALMAILLDARYSKPDLMNGYVNEVYLGQDGARAVHGFGLASQFYFGQPIGELKSEHIALLVAIVRGPSFYDPRTQPRRAMNRRNLVLDLLAQHGVLSEEAARAARAAPLGVLAAPRSHGNNAFPAFLDAVRAQLRSDYKTADLNSAGLRILTTLDVDVQERTQALCTQELAHVERDTAQDADSLEIGAVVSDPENGEVLALVGGRRPGYAGFNRAVSIRRPIGSLVKPFVYLTALETGRYDLATTLSNAPLEVELENGQTWSPQNYSDSDVGDVPLYRALAESINRPAVHVGLDVGVRAIARRLEQVGMDENIAPYPSLLLGALNVSPLQVAAAYTTLAGGGFRSPLHTVRAVVDENGLPLQRFSLRVARAADAAAVAQIQAAMVAVMSHGTGRRAAAVLPPNRVLAGKSGSSNDFRDGWFAGYAGDRLAVVWVGRDDNQPIGVSGTRSALPVWAQLMADLSRVNVQTPHNEDLVDVQLDYASGMLAGQGCAGTVLLPLPRDGQRPAPAPCALRPVDQPENGIRKWLRERLGDG